MYIRMEETNMNTQVRFEEKQYLGHDKAWISVRLILALFCFVAFYFTPEHDLVSQQIFFGVGCLIVIITVVMMYMIQFRTQVTNRSVLISGLWSSRLVKIDLAGIKKIEKKRYSKFFFNNPVYNLHKNGKIRFYAEGNDAIWLTDNTGLIYIIGTQKQEELFRALQEEREANV